jgi:serine/threonine protein kinase
MSTIQRRPLPALPVRSKPQLPFAPSAADRASAESAGLALLPYPTNRFTYVDLLGEGAFGKVYSAIDNQAVLPEGYAAKLERAQVTVKQAKAFREKSVDDLRDAQRKFIQATNAFDLYRNLPEEQKDANKSNELYKAEDEANDDAFAELRKYENNSKLLGENEDALALLKTQQYVVIKQIAKEKASFQDILAELRALGVLKDVCANYILCFTGGLYEDRENYYLVTEFLADYVSLRDMITPLQKDYFGSAETITGVPFLPSMYGFTVFKRRTKTQAGLRMAKICVNLIEGLRVLHIAGVAHRDLKPENILVEKRGSNIKIIDLGLSCVKESCNGIGLAGTRVYLAPELVQSTTNKPITLTLQVAQRSDIFSLGVTIYELICPRFGIDARGPFTYLADFWQRAAIDVAYLTQKPTEFLRKERTLGLFDYESPTDPLLTLNAQTEVTMDELSTLYTQEMKVPNPNLSLRPLLRRVAVNRFLPKTAAPKITAPPKVFGAANVRPLPAEYQLAPSDEKLMGGGRQKLMARDAGSEGSFDYWGAGIRPGFPAEMLPPKEFAEWTTAAAHRRDTLESANFINDLTDSVYVRFYLVDESLACRTQCVTKSLGPMSNVYLMPGRSRAQLLFEIPSGNFLRPGRRVRMYWRRNIEMLTRDGPYGINYDNRRVDNLDTRGRDYNVHIMSVGKLTS